MYLRRKRAAAPPCRELLTGEKEPNRDDEHCGEVPVHQIRRSPPQELPGIPAAFSFPFANRGSAPMTPYVPGSTTMPLPLTRICLFSNAHRNVSFFIRRTPKRRKTRSKRLNVEENMDCQPK